MDLINIILCILMLVFVYFEFKEITADYKRFIELKKELENKPNLIVIKDYVFIAILYVAVFAFMCGYGIYNILMKEIIIGILIIEMSLFCLLFVVENICLKTTYFYESGFTYKGYKFKYREIIKIVDKKDFLKGYPVELTKNQVVYVSKKAKPVLEEKYKEYKNRKSK